MNIDSMTLNLDNYTDGELLSLYSLENEQKDNHKLLDEKFNVLLINIKSNNDMSSTTKVQLVDFLQKGVERLKNNNSSNNNSFIPPLERNQLYNNNHFIIKKNSKPNLNALINPVKKARMSKLLNINTLFRKDYYQTTASNFVFELTNTISNVVCISLETTEIQNTHYIFSNKNKTNEFTVHMWEEQLNGATNGFDIIANKMKKVIKIKGGSYSGEELVDYMNKSIFSTGDLMIVACKYDKLANKVLFFRDNREADKGGKKDTATVKYKFNLDFRISDNANREIQKNMGWVLGYKKQQYTWDNDYISQGLVTTEKFEGYNPEGTYNKLGTPYALLSVDCYNNNHSQTLVSPYSESTFNDTNVLAKLPNREEDFDYDKSSNAYGFKREYFGPVNISRIKIKLLDQFGEELDLNGADYSFTLKCELLYDLNTN
tara:strand:+ start:5336 stop:6628 length:1293 start_codon:yes stop_codon:yes gene_type:complete